MSIPLRALSFFLAGILFFGNVSTRFLEAMGFPVLSAQGAGATTVTVSGRLVYDRSFTDWDENKPTTKKEPIANFLVSVVCSEADGAERIIPTMTDSKGAFSVRVNNVSNPSTFALNAIEIRYENDAAWVVSSTANAKLGDPGKSVVRYTLQRSAKRTLLSGWQVTISDKQNTHTLRGGEGYVGGEAYEVLKHLKVARDYWVDITKKSPNKVCAVSLADGPSGFYSLDKSKNVYIILAGLERFFEQTILHEYAHYLMFLETKYNISGHPHSLQTMLPPYLAYAEGWADYFAVSAQQKGSQFRFSDTTLLEKGFDLANPPLEKTNWNDGINSEAWVAAAFWALGHHVDYVDNNRINNRTNKRKLYTEAQIFDAMCESMKTPYWFIKDGRGFTVANMRDFFDALIANEGPKYSEKLDILLVFKKTGFQFDAKGAMVELRMKLPADGTWKKERHKDSKSSTQPLPSYPVDNAPAVALALAEAGEKIIIDATVTDDFGVKQVELWVDGERAEVVKEPDTDTFTFELDADGYASGSHTVEVRAYDFGGDYYTDPNGAAGDIPEGIFHTVEELLWEPGDPAPEPASTAGAMGRDAYGKGTGVFGRGGVAVLTKHAISA